MQETVNHRYQGETFPEGWRYVVLVSWACVLHLLEFDFSMVASVGCTKYRYGLPVDIDVRRSCSSAWIEYATSASFPINQNIAPRRIVKSKAAAQSLRVEFQTSQVDHRVLQALARMPVHRSFPENSGHSARAGWKRLSALVWWSFLSDHAPRWRILP